MAEAKEKQYEVLPGKKYTGKHKVYNAGQKFLHSELYGNEENIKMAIEGQKQSDGKPKKDPKIKLATGAKK